MIKVICEITIVDAEGAGTPFQENGKNFVKVESHPTKNSRLLITTPEGSFSVDKTDLLSAITNVTNIGAA